MVYEIRNTPWNRLFHTKKVEANIQQKQDSQKIVRASSDFLKRVGDVTYTQGDFESAKVTGAKSLMELLNLHKELWAAGFQNKDLGPDPCHMFRTKDIPTMRADEVFIGGDTCSLPTHNIPHWEKYKDEGKTSGGWPEYDYLTVYQIILRRYKDALIAGIYTSMNAANNDVDQLKSLGY